MLFALAIFFTGSSAHGGPGDAELCPITNRLATELKSPPASGGLGFNAIDAFFAAVAELNGYFGGDPKLTFSTGEHRLAGPPAKCLRQMADIFVLAVDAGKKSQAAVRDAGFQIIGHADATGDEARNYRLSFERAFSAGQAISQVVRTRLGWSPTIKVEGRGGTDPWWCGVEDVKGATVETPACAVLPGKPGKIAPDKVARVRNDRRLEIRFSGASIAGPRIDLIARDMKLGPAADVDFARLLRFEPRMRYFPDGAAALQPLRMTLGESSDPACLALGENWPETEWQTFSGAPASALEPGAAAKPGRFDEANLAARLRVVPMVTRNQGRPNKARVLLELATGTVGPVRVAAPEAGTPTTGTKTPPAAGTPTAETLATTAASTDEAAGAAETTSSDDAGDMPDT